MIDGSSAISNWPEAFTAVGLAMAGLGVALAINTEFWENLANRGKIVETVEVLPEDFQNELTTIVVEMRASARAGEHSSARVIEWATRITDAIEEATGE